MNLGDLYSAQSQAVSHRKPIKIPLSAMIHAEMPAKRELGAYQARTALVREQLEQEAGIAKQQQELSEEALSAQKKAANMSTGISAIGTGIQGAYTLAQLQKMGYLGGGTKAGTDFREGASGYDVPGSGIGKEGMTFGNMAGPLVAGAGVGYGVAKLTKSPVAGVAAGAATTIALSKPAQDLISEGLKALWG